MLPFQANPSRRRRGPLRSLHGFTLIELLIVIAIIAFLAALLSPALSHVALQAKISKTSGNLRQIGAAFHLYIGDHDGRIPGPVTVAVYNYGRQQPAPGDSPHLGAYLARYLGASDASNDPGKSAHYSVLKALTCPALSADAQNDFRTANYRIWDPGNQTAGNPDSIFGEWAGASFAEASQKQAQPKRMAAVSALAARTPILSTADQQVWVSIDNGKLPEKGVFNGKRLWMFLDGSQALSGAANATGVRR